MKEFPGAVGGLLVHFSTAKAARTEAAFAPDA